MADSERDFLDDVVSEGEPQETPEVPETEVEPEQAGTVEQQPEVTATEASTAPEVKEDKTVPYAAMKAEREKRQAEQQRREQLEREVAQLRQAAPEPSFYEAPEQFVQAMEQRANERLYLALEAQAREAYPDYDEVFAAVKEHAEGNPAVRQEILSAPNPAVAAYKLGKKLREFERMQDPGAYRQQIEAEVRAKVEAEFKAKEAERAKAVAALPPDLTQARSAKGQFVPASESVFDEIFPK